MAAPTPAPIEHAVTAGSSRLRAKPLAALAAALAAALTFGALALAMAIAPASSASAHDYLVGSTPAVNAVQTTPLKTVSLTFDDIVLNLGGDGASSLVQVTGPDGAKTHFETGCPTIDGRVVTVPVALGGPGKYLVTWQIVSADGHVVSDSLQFSYQPPAGTAAAKGTAARPACGTASSAATAPATGAASNQAGSNSQAAGGSGSAGTSGSLAIVITIAAVIVGLAVIGVIIILLTARRNPKTSTPRKAKRLPQPDDE